ncbi:MAG: DUF4864 domain-containing protein [Panacagrimonas sp.]
MTHHPIPAILLFLSLLLPAASAQDAAARGPHPDLEPPQVVAAMLEAMKKNSPQGLAELYQFSSPGNRQRTGPLPQFMAMIREGFPDMLGHRESRVATPLIDGERAMLPVEILGSDNQPHRYIFLLSRQSMPECNGCWMADAVFSPDQEGPDGPDGPGPQSAPEYPA